MKIKLMHNTPLEVADIAISKCYGKEPYADLEKQQSRINRVANVSKHSSTIEHLEYSFDIDGVSRALLQELARHRLFSFTVRSSRYTLKELKNEPHFINCSSISDTLDEVEWHEDGYNRACNYLVMTGIDAVDIASIQALDNLAELVQSGLPNDMTKYCMPENYKTSLVLTGNARALQNFFSLRTDSHALWEIQNLAKAMYDVIPQDHTFLFESNIKDS